jgi:hypothetical protein
MVASDRPERSGMADSTVVLWREVEGEEAVLWRGPSGRGGGCGGGTTYQWWRLFLASAAIAKESEREGLER